MFCQLDQQRVVGQVRLDNHPARLFGAARSAGDLHDQLRHALAGAKITREQSAVGIQDRHQGHAWKVMPFGKHLRADQNAWLAFLDGGEQLVHRVFTRGAVAVDPQHRVIREKNAQALFGALGARADRAQVYFAALRAVARHPLNVPAVMAAQLAMALVHGHASVAALALGHPAAVVAQQRRRKAPAIEEHQHLLAGGEGLADGLLHRPGNTAVQRATFHVQTQEAWLLGAAGTLVKAQQSVTAGVGIVQAFQGRRCRAQHDWDVFLARAHQSQVACVVAQAFLLFIGAVMLLVDDDQPGIFHRCEQGRACANNNVGLAVSCCQPRLQALTVIDCRVHQGDACVETLLEARQRLRPQVDLGDQYQCLFAGLQGFADQLQIDFGLAAACDAGQQERVVAVEACANRFIGGALLGVQR